MSPESLLSAPEKHSLKSTIRDPLLLAVSLGLALSLVGLVECAWWLPQVPSWRGDVGAVPVLLVKYFGAGVLAAMAAVCWLKPARVTSICQRIPRRLVTGAALLVSLTCLLCLIVARRPLHEPRPSAPNVVLVVLDTTRADVVGCTPADERRELLRAPSTGTLNRLAHDGLLFEQAMATAPWTLPSHATLFTGLGTHQHGASWEHRLLPERHATLAEQLRDRSYQTAAFSANAWISAAQHFDQGFEYFEETWRGGRLGRRALLFRAYHALVRVWDEALGNRPPWGDQFAERTNQDLGEWLAAERDPGRPLFLFLNYLEPHQPYLPPGSHRSSSSSFDQGELYRRVPPLELPEERRRELRNLYLGEVNYVDRRLGEAIELLRSNGELEDAVVVVTSDHGEHLGEHRRWGHQFSLHQTLLHVPLVLWAPTRTPRRGRVSEPVSLTQVMPTILSLTGESVEGATLLDVADRDPRPLFAEYQPPRHQRQDYIRRQPDLDRRWLDREFRAVRLGPWKLLETSDRPPRLFHLGRDPGEHQDLADRQPHRVAELQALLEQELGSFPRAPGEMAAGDTDAALQRQLQELGYDGK